MPEIFSNGGWLRLGPVKGVARLVLPDSHTDFVLTVVVEDFAFIILCLALLALLAFVIIWRLRRARSNE